MKTLTRITLAAGALLAIAAPAAQALPKDNAIQPSPIYFGVVKSGTHPTKTATVTNHTGHAQRIRKFILAGAGGGRFTLTSKRATCRLNLRLANGDSCTVVIRVATERVEFQETNLQINYGRSLRYPHGQRGQWNAFVFAHVVA